MDKGPPFETALSRVLSGIRRELANGGRADVASRGLAIGSLRLAHPALAGERGERSERAPREGSGVAPRVRL